MWLLDRPIGTAKEALGAPIGQACQPDLILPLVWTALASKDGQRAVLGGRESGDGSVVGPDDAALAGDRAEHQPASVRTMRSQKEEVLRLRVQHGVVCPEEVMAG